LADPKAISSIGSRVLSGDFGPASGPAFDLNNSDFWFRIAFHDAPCIREEDMERITALYRANLPILPSLKMMKQQTKVLVRFAEDYIKAQSPRVGQTVSAPT
jgi:hypothetical protein